MMNDVSNIVLSKQYGVRILGDHTQFRVWSPSARDIKVRIYRTAKAIRYRTFDMNKDSDGIWYLEVAENLEGQFYTYLVDDHFEIVDPFVHSTCGNSTKGAIVEGHRVNPKGFLEHKIPKALPPTQSIIYEVHVNDFSIGEDTGFEYKGKYLAFTEEGLLYNGQKIGIDHLVELGITHVHLLPVYDFITVNDYDSKGYNWGYDPYLFNAPEGSYALDPDDPTSRILELKRLIMALHEHDIRVVLDVVYNHTYFGGTSNFHRLMPYVFHRTDKTHFHNGSGCGNELDTEHPFVAKFILESLIYWHDVYKVDGFRFDLMGLYDVDFVNTMRDALRAIRPDILLYGEPWTGGPSGLALDKQFLKGKQDGVALFNDDFRNAIKGSNDGSDTGFVGGGKYRKDDVYAGCFGSVHFSKEIIGFAKKASDSINYVSSHDNLILMDKITKAFPHGEFEDKQNMNALAMTMVIMSFGTPFIQAGTEMLRSKYGDHNSYKSSYLVNRIHWENKSKFRHVFDYVKTLIEFRRSQKVFELVEKADLIKCIQVLSSDHDVIHYEIRSPYPGDHQRIQILYNGGFHDKHIGVKGMKLEIDGALYYRKHVKVEEGVVFLPKLSAAILTEA